MGLDDLDVDIQVRILKTLPLKTLVLLMSTCKSMFSLVSSPYLTTSLNPPKTLLHIYSYVTPRGDRHFFTCQDLEKRSMNDTCCPVDSTYFIIGYSYGLVCFNNNFHVDHKNLVFWNPFIGRVLVVPLPMMSAKRGALGFGFDSSKMDYKVVRIGILPNSRPHNIWADIFMLFSRTWRRAIGCISSQVSRIMGEGVYMYGVMHWILKVDEDRGPTYSILTFDLAKEEFGEMQVLSDMRHESIALVMLNIDDEEKLVVYQNYQGCNIWVMENYGEIESWRKLCSIYVGSDFVKVLNSLENGKIIMSTSQGRAISYNLKTQQLTYRSPCHTLPLDYIGPYVESLVFPLQIRH